jgi:hypothetical protein
MKDRLMLLSDKLLLRNRFIIETINDPLKNQSQIEHSRHRSPVNFVVNIVTGFLLTCGNLRNSLSTGRLVRLRPLL